MKRPDAARGVVEMVAPTTHAMSSGVYQYSPLAPQNIRLLRIKERHTPGEPLSCSLEHQMLKDGSIYTALSYTWGNPFPCYNEISASQVYDEQVVIVCDDKKIPISKNLFDALSLLALVKPGDFIWADGICINQSDDQEKSSQIQMMGQIYASAVGICIWLGPETDDIGDVVWMHEVLGQAIQDEIARAGDATYEYRLHDAAFFTRLGLSHPGDRWNSYVRFLERRWFRRSWVIQELALARQVDVYCGPRRLSWCQMVGLASFLNRSGWNFAIQKEVTRESNTPIGDEILVMDAFRSPMGSSDKDAKEGFRKRMRSICGTENIYALAELQLVDARACEASQGQDKVFSIFGMLKVEFPLADDIPVPYSHDVVRVFTEMASLVVLHEPILSILARKEDSSRRVLTDLPSWIPDFTVRTFPESLVERAQGIAYNASNVLAVPQSFRQVVDGQLLLDGACLDTIVEVGLPLADYASGRKSSPRRLYAAFDLCSRLKPICTLPDGSQEDRIEVLWRTMIGNGQGHQGQSPASHRMGACFFHWILVHLSLSHHMLEVDGKPTTNFLDPYASLEELRSTSSGSSSSRLPTIVEILSHIRFFAEHWPQYERRMPLSSRVLESMVGCAREYELAFTAISFDRRLYRTRGGSLGIGPLSLAVGDEVWLLRDSKVPFVLRPHGGRRETCENTNYSALRGFEVVGETYFHGVMYGEMFARSSDMSWEKIRLV